MILSCSGARLSYASHRKLSHVNSGGNLAVKSIPVLSVCPGQESRLTAPHIVATPTRYLQCLIQANAKGCSSRQMPGLFPVHPRHAHKPQLCNASCSIAVEYTDRYRWASAFLPRSTVGLLHCMTGVANISQMHHACSGVRMSPDPYMHKSMLNSPKVPSYWWLCCLPVLSACVVIWCYLVAGWASC